MQQQIFGCLKDTLSILIVLKDPTVVKKIIRFIQPTYIYNITIVNSVKGAQEVLDKERVHLCLLGSEFKEFAIINKYLYTSFIIFVIDDINYHEIFNYVKLGVKTLIDKGSINFSLIKIINHFSLRNVINPFYRRGFEDILSVSTEKLIERNPSGVTDWASDCGISERQLRWIWNIRFKVKTRIVLFIYKIYKTAFDVKNPLDKKTFEQLTFFFISHKNEIIDYINYLQLKDVPVYKMFFQS